MFSLKILNSQIFINIDKNTDHLIRNNINQIMGFMNDIESVAYLYQKSIINVTNDL